MRVTVPFKKTLDNAIIPKYAHKGDAGLDLFAADMNFNYDYNFLEIDTGIAIQLPKNYMGLVFPRSSVSKTSHFLRNSVGIIDSGYRDSIKLRFSIKEGREHLEYVIGDKIAQLIVMPYPTIEMVEQNSLNESERGFGGFGSTGW